MGAPEETVANSQLLDEKEGEWHGAEASLRHARAALEQVPERHKESQQHLRTLLVELYGKDGLEADLEALIKARGVVKKTRDEFKKSAMTVAKTKALAAAQREWKQMGAQITALRKKIDAITEEIDFENLNADNLLKWSETLPDEISEFEESIGDLEREIPKLQVLAGADELFEDLFGCSMDNVLELLGDYGEPIQNVVERLLEDCGKPLVNGVGSIAGKLYSLMVDFNEHFGDSRARAVASQTKSEAARFTMLLKSGVEVNHALSLMGKTKRPLIKLALPRLFITRSTTATGEDGIAVSDGDESPKAETSSKLIRRIWKILEALAEDDSGGPSEFSC